MHVLFDHQIFSLQNEGGISRYFAELAKELESLGVTVSLGVAVSDNRYIDAPLKAGRLRAWRHIPERVRVKTMKIINGAYSNRMLASQRIDILHPTYYDPYFLGEKKSLVPIVITVYDLIHEIYSEQFPGSERFREHMKKCVHAATSIIAISKSTRADILRYYSVDENKVHVIPLGVSMGSNSFGRSIHASQRRYVLFVGKRSGYKNFQTCLRAFAIVAAKSATDLELIAVGGGPFTHDELNQIGSLGLSQRVQHETADDSQLRFLYEGALALVYISLYEGFGLPIVEAFSCGCPVIASNTSSMPEVGGDAALYVDPSDPVEIASTVLKLLDDSPLRDALARKGIERSKEFTWTKTAELTLRVYEEVMDNAREGLSA